MTHRTVGEARRGLATVREWYDKMPPAKRAMGDIQASEFGETVAAERGVLTQIEARRERIAVACLAALVGGSAADGFMVGPELAATAVCLADDLAAALDGPRPGTAWDNAPFKEPPI